MVDVGSCLLIVIIDIQSITDHGHDTITWHCFIHISCFRPQDSQIKLNQTNKAQFLKVLACLLENNQSKTQFSLLTLFQEDPRYVILAVVDVLRLSFALASLAVTPHICLWFFVILADA